jgi:hypothetical protein
MNKTQMLRSIIVALFVGLLSSKAQAGTWVPYGPETFTRGTGAPSDVLRTFSILNPNTTYTLRVDNGGLQGQLPKSSGVISLNGVQIVSEQDLNGGVTLLQKNITLQLTNTVDISLRGQPGSGISVQVIGVDNDPPVISATVSPLPNAAGWNNSNVTVTFACSDKTSGIAVCPSPVTVSTEGANQLISGTATDLAGNTATRSVTINLDKTPPTISGTINPPPDAGGFSSSAVTVTFTCSDALSGVASCTSPLSVTSEGTNPVVGTATDNAGNTATTTVTVNISFNYFYVRSYQGKCLDYGTSPSANGATVFLNDCGQAHPIRVVEIGDQTDSQGNKYRTDGLGNKFYYDVLLFAGKQVIGVHNTQANAVDGAALPPLPGSAIELQTYNPNLVSGGLKNQIFRFDGDSIIPEGFLACLNTDTNLCSTPQPPQLVVQVQNARGTNGSPIIAGLRNLTDNEFWDFNAIDGSGRFPTKGFMMVGSPGQLSGSICGDPSQCGNWGRVIVINPNFSCFVEGATETACIDVSANPTLVLPAGVTLRGTRRGTLFGSELHALYTSSQSMLEIRGDYVRITGLRLHGYTRSTDDIQNTTQAIYVGSPGPATGPLFSVGTTTQFVAIIDHTDISDWEGAAVNVNGPYHLNQNVSFCSFIYQGVQYTQSCSDEIAFPPTGQFVRVADDSATLSNLRVEHNFLHHNERNNGGYGVVTSNGGRVSINGNTCLLNRHCIASDGEPHNEYRAATNLVLSTVPHYGLTVNQDFDMHGTNGGYGDAAGYYVDIVGNTFLGTDHSNYWLRGGPIVPTDFHNNISLQDSGLNPLGQGAVVRHTCTPTIVCADQIDINIFGDQFDAPNPTNRLGVGDFDADGVQDTFLATGAAWYYAPGGQREWRLLSAQTQTIDQVLLGDFDGDRRTDVIAIQNGQFVISWGGISTWEVLNTDPTGGRLFLLPSAVTAMTVGDFDGDGMPDIFWADTRTWWVSYGGNTPFVMVGTSGFSLQDLRFGDFDANGTTDVFGITGGNWSVSYSPKFARNQLFSGWQTLQPALGDGTANGLIVADFDGNGIADVASPCFLLFAFTGLNISYGGTQGFSQNCNLGGYGLFTPVNGGLGHFSGGKGTDILIWNGNVIWVVPAGIGVPRALSSQDMR